MRAHHANSGGRRAVVALTVGLAAATGGAALLVACSDLFHATDDLKTACELDAGGDACKPSLAVDAMPDTAPLDAAVDAGPIDFCLWNAARARKGAETACMLLGMCEEPMGKQRFGECMAHALLAYDCNANANRKVKDRTRDYWTCMAGVTECGGVEACNYPIPKTCVAQTVVLCGQDDATADTRLDCSGVQTGFVPRTENCTAWGQACASENSFAICSGDKSLRCTKSGCVGTALSDCPVDGGNNDGIDCKNFGAQACVKNGAISACVAEGATSCTPSNAVTCDGNVARSCPSGVEEKVDCAAITLRSSTCNAIATPSAALGVASACFPQTSCADGGSSETCAGNTITSCYRGIFYSLDCPNGCIFVTTPEGNRAACKKP